MPACTNCGRVTDLWLCGVCQSVTGRPATPTCRLCHRPMSGQNAVCSSCGATGNPKGTPPPAHLKPLFKDTLDAVRENGGPVLLVCHPNVSRAFVLRSLRENYNATENEIQGITFAIPSGLPSHGPFKSILIDQDITDELTRETILDLRERPPPPSVWEWLRKPAV